MSSPATQELIIPFEQALSTDVVPLSDGDFADAEEVKRAESPVNGLKRFVEARYVAASRHFGAAVIQGFLAGAALNRAKERVEPKQWLRFMRQSFGDGKSSVSIRTCQRYMKLAKRFPQIAERVGKVIDATRVSLSQVEEILGGMSIRAALRLASDHHEIDMEGDGHATEVPDTEAEKLTVDSAIAANNWLTPEIVIRMLERMWGKIDVDPCASPNAIEHVDAQQRYLPSDDGLAADNRWFGKVFISPGHSGNLRPWVERATGEFEASRIEEAVLLLPAATDADWAELIQPYPHAFLHTRQVVAVAHQPDAQVVLPQPGMLIYLAAPDRLTTFAEHFGTLADIYRPYVFGNEAS